MNKLFRKVPVKQGSYPGMFDFFKGIAVISFILHHLLFQYDEIFFSSVPEVVGVLYVLWTMLMMPSFFLMCGYGFRPMPIKKCIKKQAELLFLPYTYIGIGSAVGFAAVDFLVNHNLVKAIKYALYIIPMRFWLGATTTLQIGKYTVNGAHGWFFLTIFEATILLNIIYNLVPRKWIPYTVTGSLVLGWLLNLYGPPLPYCIPQALIAVFRMYVGVLIKEKKLFEIKFGWLHYWWILGIFIVNIASGFYMESSRMVAENQLVQILVVTFMGYMMLRGFLYLNVFRFPFREQISIIGRYSLWILSIHFIEDLALHWHIWVKVVNLPFRYEFPVMFVIKSLIIYAGYKLLRYYNDKKTAKLIEAKRLARQQQMSNK